MSLQSHSLSGMASIIRSYYRRPNHQRPPIHQPGLIRLRQKDVDAAPIFKLPLEMLMEICKYMSLTDLSRLMQTCTWMHEDVSPLVYAKICVSDLDAGPCFRTLSYPINPFVDYALLVKEIEYSFTVTVDHHLAFPLLCSTLRYTKNVHTLRLTDDSINARFVVRCLKAYGIFAQSPNKSYSDKYHLPRLRTLRISANHELIELIDLRQLKNVYIGRFHPQAFPEAIIPALKLHQTKCLATCLTVSVWTSPLGDLVLPQILDHFPALKTMHLIQNSIVCKDVLERLSATSQRHLHLTSLTINRPLPRSPTTATNIEAPRYLYLLQGYLHRTIPLYPELQTVQLGPLLWKLDSRIDVWTPKPCADTIEWWRTAAIDWRVAGLSRLGKEKEVWQMENDMVRFWDFAYSDPDAMAL
ncbi:hypothetical protein PLICRDRAFT_171384 [Plicaturopsis crispa FD-325 SS-3]|nr:hypothetical protein PLICRDRAFT_171384 [Plicaturopsis crispa FD-325 SS-3]